MHETNQSLEEVTSKYINAYKNDMDTLNILPNTIEPKATQNVDIMIEMIKI